MTFWEKITGNDMTKELQIFESRAQKLPQDYQIVYKEIQKYLFKVGPVELTEGTELLSGIVDLFEDGVALGKSVLEVTGRDRWTGGTRPLSRYHSRYRRRTDAR